MTASMNYPGRRASGFWGQRQRTRSRPVLSNALSNAAPAFLVSRPGPAYPEYSTKRPAEAAQAATG
jgi:hypothetical protein